MYILPFLLITIMFWLPQRKTGSVLRVSQKFSPSTTLRMILISTFQYLTRIYCWIPVSTWIWSKISASTPFLMTLILCNCYSTQISILTLSMLQDNSSLISNCVYLTSKEYNKIPTLSTDSFSIFHTNIHSLRNKHDNLSEFLSNLNTTFSIIGLSETWLDESTENLYAIPGYTFLSSSRQHKRGGGVGFFIKSNYHFKVRSDLQSSNAKLYESIFAEIIQPRSKNIIIGCIYKPPEASVSDFNTSISNTLSTISFENKLSYIMGDFNINLLNSDSHQPTNDFINLIWHPTVCIL